MIDDHGGESIRVEGEEGRSGGQAEQGSD